MSYSLGIDASTQSISALIIDLDSGEFVCENSINFDEKLPEFNTVNGVIEGNTDGEVFSNPLMWLNALELLFEDISKKCDVKKIKAISGAGQQHGSVYLNANWLKNINKLKSNISLSEQIRPCLSRLEAPIWMDTSTKIECEEISNAIGGKDNVCRKSGSISIERFTGPQIRRFYKTSPDSYLQTKRIHLVSSFICSILSGKDCPIDTGDGAGMNLLNIDNFKWDSELLDSTAPDLYSKLPEIVSGDNLCGELAPFFVERYGFNHGVKINVFTGDNPSSLVGNGASTPGKTVISLGTSDTYFAAMPKILSDPNGFGHVLGNPSGGSMSLQCFLNGSLAREKIKDRFNFNWEEFTDALTQTIPGNDGNLMIPFFGPEISPRCNIKEPILEGSVKFLNNEAPELAIRSCVEGQFLNMKVHTDWMKINPKEILITGGASQNNSIVKILANIFQANIKRISTSGSVALGGALRAAQNCLGCSLVELEKTFCSIDNNIIYPDKDTKNIYNISIKKYQDLIKKLK